MRTRDMHPLCCISVDFAGIGGRSPPPPQAQPDNAEFATPADPPPPPGGASAAVAGTLYKWTNIGKGWRRRWFSLRNGVLTYSKIRPREQQPAEAALFEGEGGISVRVIGAPAAARLSRPGAGDRKPRKPSRVVQLKISSFRESKSDHRKFYVFSPTKTLHLRTDSSIDRVAWLEALSSATNEFTINGGIPCLQDVSFSTDKLRERMYAEGVDEILIRDCEQIMRSEFLEYHRQLKLRYDENLSFTGTFRQQFEAVDGADIDITTTEGQLQLKHEYSSSGQETYHEYSTTESSDDIEKQELDELSDEDELTFFDTKECFGDYVNISATQIPSAGSLMSSQVQFHLGNVHAMDVDPMVKEQKTFPHIKRRLKLPDPIEKEKSVSLWSMIKDNVGKDLTRVCLPVYFNEPLSSLQKCFEDLEYSHLLDQAYEYGKMGNSLMRIVNVAAFAVSGYASCDGRLCKPFNPLLGETYEADYPEKGIRFFAEKVSHHPMLIACHCEGKGWKFWGDSNLKSKFWGQSIQLDPVGVLTLEFDDGEVFQWNKVTTTIYNLIIGKVSCNHHGLMNIRGNRQYSCKLKFKEHSILERNPRQVQGYVEDVNGNKVATLTGKWDDNMYYTLDTEVSRTRNSYPPQNATLLWKRSQPPPNPTRYNLTSFAITLNELTRELQDLLPPTDSRLRPDQRYLENGEYEKANAEKLRLEQRQRMSRKFQENGWKPKWFEKDSESGTFRYMGGYWEARDQKKWDDCMDIFSDFSDQSNAVHCTRKNQESA